MQLTDSGENGIYPNGWIEMVLNDNKSITLGKQSFDSDSSEIMFCIDEMFGGVNNITLDLDYGTGITVTDTNGLNNNNPVIYNSTHHR